MSAIAASVESYESWLREHLGEDVVKKDLARKRKRMKQSAFIFLRATYWRWTEIIFDVCPDLAEAPEVLAVGDIHLENFGTWRDADGRLVWGINDFDEAADMPYALDLVRLAASALLAQQSLHDKELDDRDFEAAAAAVLEGYRHGLKDPQAITLDRDHGWLRNAVVVDKDRRKKFWEIIAGAKEDSAPANYRQALLAALPEENLAMTTARRSAGTGSLGRPRWIGIADWRGGPVVREAKALIPSAWSRATVRGGKVGQGRRKIHVGTLAAGRFRAPDPWFSVMDNLAIRRLSPNNRKIEVEDDADVLLRPRLWELMGFELANIHLGVADRTDAIKTDLEQRKRGWLAKCTEAACAAVTRDFEAWRKE